MIHFCKLQSTQQDHEFLPAEISAKRGGILLADISVFVESGNEEFPTMVIVMQGDGFMIDTPIEQFSEIMRRFYA